MDRGWVPPTDANLNHISQEYAYEDLLFATGGFSSASRLGEGSYGSVHGGTLRDGTEVAIKKLSRPKEGGFREEVEVLSRFRHPNLVILMGFARREKERYLVYENLPGGDLCAKLQKDGANFDWRRRISVALDAALGLSHLHNSRPQVFHRDVKTQNILLDRNGTGKMGDFGLALLAQPNSTALMVNETSGTIGYADPLYIRTGVVTERSEVYSFGMVMLEILTARPPALQGPSGRVEYQFAHLDGQIARLHPMIDRRASWPSELVESCGRFGFRCISKEEISRPNFAQIVGALRGLLREHPEERLRQHHSSSSTYTPKGDVQRERAVVQKQHQPVVVTPKGDVQRERAAVQQQHRPIDGTPKGDVQRERAAVQQQHQPVVVTPKGDVQRERVAVQQQQHPVVVRRASEDGKGGGKDSANGGAAVGAYPGRGPEGSPQAGAMQFALPLREARQHRESTPRAAEQRRGAAEEVQKPLPQAAAEFCPLCSSLLKNDAKFCGKCGKPRPQVPRAVEQDRAGPPLGGEVSPDMERQIRSLEEGMGFSRLQTSEALKRCSTVEAAVDWILSPDRNWN